MTFVDSKPVILRTAVAAAVAFLAGGALVLWLAYAEGAPPATQPTGSPELPGAATPMSTARPTDPSDSQGATLAEPLPQRDPQAQIAQERRSVIVDAVQRVARSVASVVISGTRRVPIFDDPFFRFFAFGPTERRPIIVQSGSAVVISPDGEFLTNHHVVEFAERIELLLANGEVRTAEVVGASPELDLALLQADGNDLTPAAFGSAEDLLVGEWLVAVGYPVGGRGVTTESRFHPTVTVGVVSALNRSFTPGAGRRGDRQYYADMIQTDAAINPGNSGGPLANAAGEVVGINTFILTESGGSEGLGFAIPIERALKAADEFRRYGYVRPIDLDDIAVQRVNPNIARLYELDVARGMFVTDPGVAESAGLRTEDILLDVDGERVNTMEEARLALIPRFVGDRVILGVWRDGRRVELTFELREDRRAVR